MYAHTHQSRHKASGRDITLTVWNIIRQIVFIYLFLIALGLPCCPGFSLAAASRAYSLVASHCGGFSCCGARALGHKSFSRCSTWAQQLWRTGLVAPRLACGTFLDEGLNPCLLHRWADSLPLSDQGNPILFHFDLLNGFPVYYHVSMSQPVVAAFEKYCPGAETK